MRARLAPLVVALALASIPARAGDEPRPTVVAPLPQPAVSHGFLQSFLAPRMTAVMQSSGATAVDYAGLAQNPWTRDREVVDRVERSAIRATKSALKRYAIETFNLDAWFPIAGKGRAGAGASGEGSSGAALRFGISHMAPRAELSLPVAAGRVALAADARGRLGATFRTASSNLRLGASVDPSEHQATFELGLRF